MHAMDLVRDQSKLENDLSKNDLLQKDIKKIVSYVTPYIPLIGIISGGVTVGSHVIEKNMYDFGDEIVRKKGGGEEATIEEPEQEEDTTEKEEKPTQ